MGWAIMARQSGEEMLKIIAFALPLASLGGFDALAAMKESHEVSSSQDEEEEEEGDREGEKVKEEDKEVSLGEVSLMEGDEGVSLLSLEMWKGVAISACRLNTWNGGEARATRCNLIVHMSVMSLTSNVFYALA